MAAPFADRLAALVEERSSQVCLGLDPDPARIEVAARPPDGSAPADAAAAAVVEHCRALIGAAGPACVAVKPQLACFERLGSAGWKALEQVVADAKQAGLLVIADGKRGDVAVTAAAYGQALFGSTPTPWGEAAGLGADAATANPLLGSDALEPLIAAAAAAGGGLFVLVRTSNPGAAEFFDLDTAGQPGINDVPIECSASRPPRSGQLSARFAALVAESGERLLGDSGLSGLGAVVGATEPDHLAELREAMPRSIFLVPGVGAQGGRPDALGPAFGSHPASAIVTASRSIAGATDPAAAAEQLRDELWRVSQAPTR